MKLKRHVRSRTYSAGVALQELDLLVQFDVVCPQAVQLVLQGLHRLLHGAILLQAETQQTNNPGFTSPEKTRTDAEYEDEGVTHHFQLLVARAEPLPLAGDDGEQRVHLTLRKLSGSTGARTCGKHSVVVTFHHSLHVTDLISSVWGKYAHL